MKQADEREHLFIGHPRWSCRLLSGATVLLLLVLLHLLMSPTGGGGQVARCFTLAVLLVPEMAKAWIARGAPLL